MKTLDFCFRRNDKNLTFLTFYEVVKYKSWFKEYSKKYDLKIWAYCLMNNHVHFICIPHKESSLSKTFNTLHMKYSQYFNEKKRARGHLWQGRFYSCILDEKHLRACVRYIENNPVRARVVENAEDYKWSSAKGHIIKGSDPLLSEDCNIEEEEKDWKAYLSGSEDKEIIEAIKKNSTTGRPCGNDSFIEKIEGLLGRELKAKAWGRPRKKR